MQKTKNSKRNSKQTDPNTNINYDEVKRKLNAGNLLVAEPLKKQGSGPSKSQIARLKKFYNTTRWLPNSAFTTYFGKPAFENYGYGNINPVYGGLFYGNYMLSHNMNPIDGANHPPEKQVYSSAMMKSLQRKGIRRPSPPRNVPEEIRNTPEELQEIKTRCQIFQLPNNFPSRDIIPPNLLKARYFRSGKNTPENSDEENEDEYEEWNVENVLSGKKNRKRKVNKREKFDPYKQGKIQLKKKKMKEGLDNKIDDNLYTRTMEKKRKKKEEGIESESYEEEEESLNTKDREYLKEKEFYEKMLGEDGLKNLEDLSKMNLQTKEMEELNNNINKEEEEKNFDGNNINNENENNCINQFCPICNPDANNLTFKSTDKKIITNPLKKKENPALLPPNYDLHCFCNKNGDNHGYVCCLHHNLKPFNVEEKDPRFYSGMPPCTMNNVVPAGKPTFNNPPLNLFG